jgi:UDP-3-O-[3-hydroxymyristoyl] glucosamine N-acyltransferase
MTKKVKIIELARKVKGRIEGHFDEEAKVTGTCAIDNYVANKVSFVRNKKYGEMLADVRNAVILIPEDLVEFCRRFPQNTYIVVKDVLNSMMDMQDFFYSDQFLIAEEGISPTAKIDKSATIGNRVYIGENVYIGGNTVIGDGTKIMHNCCIYENVVVGKGTYIYPGVYIYKNSQIGNDCVIHSGVRIGVDGFRFEQYVKEKLVRKWLHMGRVVIGDRVEIGANTAIARATFEDGATIISDDVKIDNLVHIAHNAKIGERTLIAAQSCIGGSDRIGEDVWIGIGVSISNGVSVGNRAKVLLNAVVAYDVPEDETVSGFYAMPHRQWKRVYERLKEG